MIELRSMPSSIITSSKRIDRFESSRTAVEGNRRDSGSLKKNDDSVRCEFKSSF